MFDPVANRPDAQLAAAIVWFDSYVTNVDRTARNTNLLMWHRRLWLIDHGACLYFHHSWQHHMQRSVDIFPMIKEHVLLQFAGSIEQAAQRLSARLTPDVIQATVALIPDSWLQGDATFDSPDRFREAYFQYLTRRLQPRWSSCWRGW